jgi:hypothetical protein
MTFHQARVFALREDSRLVELSVAKPTPLLLVAKRLKGSHT